MRQSVQHIISFTAAASQALGPNGQRVGLWIACSNTRYCWRLSSAPTSDTAGWNMASSAQGIFLRKEDIGDIIGQALFIFGAASGVVSIIEVIEL